jgi:uncharacterized membrane protein HdeD (DUF308 family)
LTAVLQASGNRAHLSKLEGIRPKELIVATTDLLFPMTGLFAKNWWVLLLRGIVAILFGLMVFTRPLVTLATLVWVFGIYAILDGIFSLIAAISGRRRGENRWLLALEGLAGLGVGILTLRAPAITAVTLMFFIAAWALATGLLRIVEAIRLRKEISGEFWLGLSGLASVIFAFLVMANPAAGALVMAWVIGWFACFMGAMLVALSFRVHHLRGRLP